MINQTNKRQAKPVILETVEALRAFVSQARQNDQTVGLVPTMGALHAGHLSLVEQIKTKADICIVSIFVNPTQFAPEEDLDSYPRTWEADLAKLEEVGAHAVFYPSVTEMYPDGFATTVSVGGVTEPLEGANRPGHFDGVATVVTKLLLQAGPDCAIFGEKDYQQLQLIRRMVADLNIPVEILGAPIKRDEKGLALSSRNSYLSDAEYEIALSLNKTLYAMAARIAEGEEDYEALESWGKSQLLKNGFEAVDYITVRDPATLLSPAAVAKKLRILAAARVGKTRLIDNIEALAP